MSAKHQTLAVRNKALSVLAGSVRAAELVPAQLDLDDTELDDIELDDNGAVEENRHQGAHQDGVVVAVDNLSSSDPLLWTTCPDLTDRPARQDR